MGKSKLIKGPHDTYLIKTEIDIGKKINFLIYKKDTIVNNFNINEFKQDFEN